MADTKIGLIPAALLAGGIAFAGVQLGGDGEANAPRYQLRGFNELKPLLLQERYQSLMNAGLRIPAYIEALTGISNAMIRSAPPAAAVMRDVSDFVGNIPFVAHNVSFDAKFWDAKLARIQRTRRQDFVCSLLLSRRLLPLAPSHKLGVLVEYAKLPVAGRYHRTLAGRQAHPRATLRSLHSGLR